MELQVDGQRVFAATGGRPFDAKLPAIVFLHGAGMDHSVWALQTRYFAHHGRAVLAVDLPGHGRSTGPGLEDIDAMAGWLARLLDAAGLARAALAGHSMGALVALASAAALGERVRALALLGAAARMPVHPDLLAAAAANDHLAIDLITAWGHGASGHLGGNRAPGLWLMGGAERVLERSQAGILHRDLAACTAYEGGSEAASRVVCPCLVVVGVDDRMAPAKAGRALAGEIPGARVAEIADCGHMMMLERPDQTLDALRTVL